MWRGLMVVLVLAGAARAQDRIVPKTTTARLKAVLDAQRTKHKVAALGAAVVTSAGVQSWAIVGVRKAGTKVAVQEHDRWHLGSDTKAFTATLLAILAEQGKIDFDVKLPKAFPKLAKGIHPEYREVTLDQVLRHQAGLVANPPGGLEKWRASTAPVRTQRVQAIRQGLGLKPVSPPGKKTTYSNLGYILAGALAEQAMDDTWEKLVETHVLRPLDIKEFGFGAPGTVGKIDQPLLHDGKGRPAEPTPRADNPAVMGPAARLHLSLGDWAKFIQDQLAGARGKGKLLKAESYRRMHTAAAGEPYAPGGWYVEPLPPLGTLLTHHGSNNGCFASVAMVPAADVAVLVVCNQGPKSGETAGKEALIAILKEALGAR